MKYITRFCLVTTGGFLICSLGFFWVNAIVDSYFYWALGEFIKTGIYPYTFPFEYANPPTVSPPLYSILLALISTFPRPDVILHTLQLLLLAGTSMLMYKILTKVLNKHIAVIVCCMFAMYPTNIVYTSYVLTEIPAQFFLTLFIYLCVDYSRTKRLVFLSWATGLGFLMSLMKFSFMIYPIVVLIFFLTRRPKRYPLFVIPGMGICLVLIWMIFHYRTTGVFHITDTSGAHLWNHIIADGKVLPDPTHPSMKKLYTYVSPSTNLYRYYWDLQRFILAKEKNNWLVVDSVLGDVAREAIRKYPLVYVRTSMTHFIDLFGSTLPYWSNIGTFTHPNRKLPINCKALGNIRTCSPIIETSHNRHLWDTYIRFSNWFHRTVFPVLTYVIFLPLLLGSFFFRSRTIHLMTGLFMLGTIPIALTEHIDTRYLIPFYPLLVLIIALSLSHISRIKQLKKPKLH